MGVSYSVYLGPYIEVYNPNKPTTEEYHACGKLGCSQYHNRSSNKFCPECGTQIGLVKVPSKGRKHFDVWETFNKEPICQAFWEGKPKELEDYDIYRPNMRMHPGRTFGNWEIQLVPLADMNPETEMSKFIQAIPDVLLKLHEVFGEKNVKVKWGAIATAG